LRIFNPIGKIKGVESGSRQDSVIHRMMYSWQNQIDFEIRGNQYNTFDGTPVRDFIDIRDLCDAIITVIGNLESNLPVPNILNLASGVPVTVLQLVNEFNAVISELELVGKPKKLNWKIVDTNEFDVRGFAADVSSIKNSLNWNPRVTLSDSIKSEVVY
jgi:UDP-glucose 4-epimerase